MTTTVGHARRRAFYIWLLRGAIGLALLAVAMSTGQSRVVIPALLLALIVFRGCPLCWVFGLMDCGSQACAPSARKEAA